MIKVPARRLSLTRETLHLLNQATSGTAFLFETAFISGLVGCRPAESPQGGCVATIQPQIEDPSY